MFSNVFQGSYCHTFAPPGSQLTSLLRIRVHSLHHNRGACKVFLFVARWGLGFGLGKPKDPKIPTPKKRFGVLGFAKTSMTRPFATGVQLAKAILGC